MLLFYRMLLSLVAALFLFLSACTNGNHSSTRAVGVDTEWHSLQLEGRQTNLTGFTTELLQEIGRIEKIDFIKMTVSWDRLLPGLLNKSYEAILFSMIPYNFNQNQFDFSDLFLKTGPALVMSAASNVTSLNQLNGKEIAVMPSSLGALILEKYPGILIRNYDSIPQAFNDIVKGVIDGAVVDILTAIAYCQDIYRGELKVVTPPLNEEGLRMITLHDTATDLIEEFNEGLEKLKSNGSYDKLLQKWGLQG